MNYEQKLKDTAVQILFLEEQLHRQQEEFQRLKNIVTGMKLRDQDQPDRVPGHGPQAGYQED